MTSPQISVIVPVHNVANHIADCIASLTAQTWRDFEAIVVEDGSTDDSAARLDAAIAGDPRFQVIRQENRGLSAARNAGLNKAKGAYIAFLDGDDRYAPEYLERMHAALSESGADWIACGLRNTYPDGHSDTHSTIHDAPELIPGAAPRLWPLDSWEDAIAHFPSAWNKLYRRSLIDGLRFDEGTWFEDHAFFLRAAGRSDALLHLPEPLYLQTRGRNGQITAADSDRVFEQFTVLDTLADVLAGPEKPGGRAALSRLAHRLIHERSTVLGTPDRRARFVAAARDWLALQDLPALPGPVFPPSWVLELGGTCPLSVIVPWDGQDAPLRVTLAALGAQIQRGFETLIVADDATTAERGTALAQQAGLSNARGLTTPEPGPGPARNAGLSAARGEMVVFADAGDRLQPAALAHWTDTMLRENADFGVSQFRIGLGETDAVHQGFHDMALFGPEPPQTGPVPLEADRALALHCHPTAKIFRRAFLDAQGLRFGSGPLADWQIGIGAAFAARKVLYFAWPGAESSETPECRQLWTAPDAPATLADAIETAWTTWPPQVQEALPPDWPRRLYARALWEKWCFSEMTPTVRSRFRFETLRVLRRRNWHRMTGPLDPYLSPGIQKMIGPPVPPRAKPLP